MKVSLVVAQGPRAGTAIPINKPQYVIGRDAGCQLRPASNAVSKRHCIITQREDQLFVEDLKSTNGTFLNEEKLDGEREAHDGDSLSIGPLHFNIKIETGVVAPPPVVKPRPASGDPMDEDAIASMLLTLNDESESAQKDDELDGTTIMQMLKPQTKEEEGPYRPPQKPVADKDTTSAAKSILDKYRRRPRS